MSAWVAGVALPLHIAYPRSWEQCHEAKWLATSPSCVWHAAWNHNRPTPLHLPWNRYVLWSVLVMVHQPNTLTAVPLLTHTGLTVLLTGRGPGFQDRHCARQWRSVCWIRFERSGYKDPLWWRLWWRSMESSDKDGSLALRWESFVPCVE